ncbi:MAG: carbohydrate kinase family protein [Candidatus Doudnabacteria bacterium]|jgi:sugar/nucleoside kinase (ribokinase family)
MFDIISIGDATIDTFLFIHDIEIVDIKGDKKAILNWGDKLPVDKFFRSVAGNAANNAVGSARLGLKTAFYTVLAHDVGGREIIHKMKKEGVSDRFIVIDDEHGTNASTVIVHDGERTILVYHEHRKYKLPKLVHSNWVYLTSMGQGFDKIYKDLAKYIDKYNIKLGFNPGTFQLRAGVKKNLGMLARTDLLSVNVEEAQGWVGDCDRDPEELCKKLAELGPKAIALTDGRKGAYSYSKEGFYYVPEFPGPRLEATGAGDAFTTAYIAGLFYGLSHKDAATWAPINAGSVVQSIGPQAGLLTRQEIESRLKKMKDFKAVAITGKEIKKQVMEMVNNKKD